MKSSHFAISWIYDEFHVCRVLRGKVEDHWVSPDPVPDLAAFNHALVKASASLGMHRGGDVAIAFESDEHAHVFLDLPPMQRRDLERYLERRVEQEKAFDEPAVWSYRDVTNADNSAGVLLHLMPQRVLNAVLRICQENHIVPLRMVPLTDIMVQHLPEPDTQSDDVLLVIALFDSRIEFVVTTPQGQAIFVRELKYHWREDQLERLRLDIDRTLLYVKQRQKNIGRLLIMGAEAASAIEVIANQVNLPVLSNDSGMEALFWAREVSELPNNTSSNFIPKSVRREIVCRHIVRSSAWLAYAAVLCAFVVTAWVEVLRWNQSQADPEIVTRIEALLDEKILVERRAHEFAEMEKNLRLLRPRHPPLPAWFLSRLGELVPHEVVLSRAKLGFAGDRWSFEIEGATAPTLADSATILGNLEESLESEPWRASVAQHWRDEWVEMLRDGRASETGQLGFRFNGVLGR